MEAQVLGSSAHEVSLSVTNADVGTLYVVQHELLGSPGVGFAGVIVKHHLTGECWMRVSSPKGDPSREMEAATAAAIKNMAGIKSALASSKLGKK